MATRRSRPDVRAYYFGVTLCVVGMLVWVMVGVVEIRGDTSNNYEQTQCNQGLLVLALHNVRLEDQLSKCDEKIQSQIREKYR